MTPATSTSTYTSSTVMTGNTTSLQQELSIPPNASLPPPPPPPATSPQTHPTKEERPYLLIQQIKNSKTDESPTTTIPLGPETSIHPSPKFLVVGRQLSTADLRIDHKSISRRHAALYFLPSSSSDETNASGSGMGM